LSFTTKVVSIKDKLEASSGSDTSGSLSLLNEADGVTYYHGEEVGEQGSATLTVGLANDSRDFRIDAIGRPPYGPYGLSIPHDGANARGDTVWYLRNRPDRYIVNMKITYVSFSQ
jgi:hypothetical protein